MYDEDLAAVHATAFTDLAAAAARMLLEEAPRRGRVVDLGCGDGTLLQAVSDAGFDAWGTDVSSAMVARARRRLPDADLRVAGAQDVRLPACVAAAATGEVLNHVAAAAPQALGPLLQRVHDALAPGGVFLFDVATTERVEPSRAEQSGRAWRVASRVEVNGSELVRTTDTGRQVGGRERRQREVHRIPLLDADRLQADLGALGFTVERLGGYDDYAFQAGWDGFLARKGT